MISLNPNAGRPLRLDAHLSFETGTGRLAGNRVASHISASYTTDAANTYTWSLDDDLTSRTPLNGGTSWTFSSTFVAPANQMRLETITGSDGTTIWLAHTDPFGRLVQMERNGG